MTRGRKPLPYSLVFPLAGAALLASLWLHGARGYYEPVYPGRLMSGPTPASRLAFGELAEEEVKAEDFPDKESLRYAGKSFSQWRKDLRSELKPELRIEGIKAMAAFGANGYGAEATAVVVELMRGYGYVLTASGNPYAAEDSQVLQAGWNAVRKIGPPAVPALLTALHHGNRDIRRFSISALALVEGAGRRAGPDLVRAINDRDPYIAKTACNLAVARYPGERGLVSALGRALRCPDDGVRLHATEGLGALGIHARPATVGLLEALNDPHPGVRVASIHALIKLDADPKLMVPPLVQILRSDRDGSVIQTARHYFQVQTTNPARVVPALVGMLKEGYPECEGALEALGAMGGAAGNALPELRKMMKDARGERAQRLEAIIRAVDAPTVPAAPVGATGFVRPANLPGF